MTKLEARHNLDAIIHWANGGRLWYYDMDTSEWKLHDKDAQRFCSTNKLHYVIEDQFFEIRKAYALGEYVEKRTTDNKWGKLPVEGHIFRDGDVYRIKKPTVRMYQWVCQCINGSYMLTKEYYSNQNEVEKAMQHDGEWTPIIAYEPSGKDFTLEINDLKLK